MKTPGQCLHEKCPEVLNLILNKIGNTSKIIEAMNYYAEEACRLQRELCADNAVTKWDSNKEEPFDIIVDKDSIINSPCPKL